MTPTGTLDFGGSGPPLHLAHANGYPPGAYRPLAAALAARYHVTAMLSRPLWPGSAPAGLGSWQPLADDLHDYLAARGARGWVGVGHSLGAVITVDVALRRPEFFSAVVLMDPVMLSPARLAIWNLLRRAGLARRVHPLIPGALKRRRVFESAAAMYGRYRRAPVFSRFSDGALWAYVEASARPVATDAAGAEARPGAAADLHPGQSGPGRRPAPAPGRDDNGAGGPAAEHNGGPAGPPVELAYSPEWEVAVYESGPLDLWPRLAALKPPLLVIRGAESNTFLPAALWSLRRRLPRAAVHTVPNTGHLVPLEAPELVGKLILTFLAAANR